MKKHLLFTLLACLSLGVSAQQWVNLTLNHYWNQEAFNYGDQYADGSGNVVEITRVQYYLSSFELAHDGGQASTFPDLYVLASGNISDYSLDFANVTSLEKINFALGVDAAHNHLDPNLYNANHPLAPKNPNMHWGWAAGYKFLAIEGFVDSDGDQIADKMFQFHITGDDNYFTLVKNLETTGTSTGSVLTVELNVDIAKWLQDINLVTAGINHGVFPVNETIMDNTTGKHVFQPVVANDISNPYKRESNVFFDYAMAYAPTIYYNFQKSDLVNLKVMDISGKIIITERNMASNGNYFINRELAPGTYIASLSSHKGEVITKRFVVQ